MKSQSRIGPLEQDNIGRIRSMFPYYSQQDARHAAKIIADLFEENDYLRSRAFSTLIFSGMFFFSLGCATMRYLPQLIDFFKGIP